jgi:hypothetical protein
MFKNENRIATYPANGYTIKTGMLVLFILTLFSIYFALFLVSAKTDNNNQAMVENMWLNFVPLPIPLASLILGRIYKKKGFKTTKNIVAGIIFTTLLVLYGSFTFIFSDLYSHDFGYVNRIETQIKFDLPDNGNITTQDLTEGTQSGTQAEFVRHFYSSDVVFADEDEISKFNATISQSELWLTSVKTPLMGMIPFMFSSSPYSAEYDYFMIYNTDLNTYNTLPDSSGTYRFIFIAYNSMQGTMQIGEYSLEVLI